MDKYKKMTTVPIKQWQVDYIQEALDEFNEKNGDTNFTVEEFIEFTFNDITDLMEQLVMSDYAYG